MGDWLIPLTVLLVGLLVWEIISKGRRWVFSLIIFFSVCVLFTINIATDVAIQTMDTEVWSGEIVDWKHDEEWDEWHPPVTTCTSDSKGNQSCTTTPGYWEHHYAENYIKTSDNGWIYVNKLPDGRKMDDSYPNKTEELKKYWKKGTPTASTHLYSNKVQASYSIFKHEDIDLEDFKDLPDYPDNIESKLYIKRIVGNVPNKKESIKTLDNWNTKLNKMIPDPDNKDKMKSWKQVNIIFVNVGENKPQEYGFALQDKWEGGNKNDFVVSFSMNKNGKINWVYPFSWSEVEILKLEVKDYMMGLDNVKDFKPIVNHVSKQVEEKYVRKEFKDFNYLHVDLSTVGTFFLWFFVVIGLVVRGFKRDSWGDIKYGL
ncbi:hypothetical protein WKH56_20040 [Priestia sp. SB1]|uniref:hypothetical protein n=1 Tax=Priestia sp. SB1 TaxID=3132359 RepID=UPI003175306C